MADRIPSLVLNMDDRETKVKLMQMVGKMKGLWEVTLKQRKLTWSLNQNSYYFAAVVTPFREWIREEWGESVETEEAHEMLKEKILGRKKIGEMTVAPSTRKLDTAEFADYIEKCAAWLAEFCQIVVVPSEAFTEGKK